MAKQTETNYRNSFTGNHFRLMNTFQGNATQGTESSLTDIFQFIGNFYNQIFTDPVHFTMVCLSNFRNNIANFNFGNAPAHSSNFTNCCISHRHRIFQPSKGRLNSSQNTIRRHFFQNFLYLIRSFHCLLNQIFTAEGSKAPFCTRAYDRIYSFCNYSIWFHYWRWSFQYIYRTVIHR